MLAAAATWDALAAELSATAVGYGSVVNELTSGKWHGPSSISMAKAAAPYVTWLHATAAQAEETAAQAKEAAAAYELAFAMTVPPPVIAANRSLLMALVATNFFGQNTPAIAATEADYAEMWIQDAVAMYGYAGSSSAASTLTQFSPPPPTTDSAGLAAQSATVAQAAGSSAGAQQTALFQLTSAVPAALQQLAVPTASADPLISFNPLFDVIGLGLTVPRITNMGIGYTNANVTRHAFTITLDRIAEGQGAHSGEVDGAYRYPAGVSPRGPSGVLASVGGRATSVGSLSVPPSWASAAPEIRSVALALPDSGAGVTAEAAVNMPQVPGSSFSQATLGTLSREVPPPRQPKTRPVIVRSPAAG